MADMEPSAMYSTILGVLSVAFVAQLARQFISSRNEDTDKTHATPEFKSFQRMFLFVYLTMMAADWMQGPYVYRLYSYYGFSRHDNGILFIAGFGASLLIGTWIGPVADTYGRKLACILYGVSYALSCATKHVNDFNVLLVGRVLGGIATSILWSAFEAWMVSEHNSRMFHQDLIGSTFSLMTTFNGVVAILAGFVAQAAVDVSGHPVAPFDVSGILLIFGTIFVWKAWPENYGESSRPLMEQMSEAIHELKGNTSMLRVGLQQSFFESAMYTFVFMWTPALEIGNAKIPHGLIFASFMISASLGGSLFGVIASKIPVYALTPMLYVTACGCAIVPVVTTSPLLIYSSFIVFEIVVGLFWPAIGTLRSIFVPEHCRATMINLFRFPLNFFVCAVLYYQGSMTVGSVFSICATFHGLAALCAFGLKPPKPDERDSDAPEVK